MCSMNTPWTIHLSGLRRRRAPILALLCSLAATSAFAQEPLTLREAIQQALGQNPEAAIARAGGQEAKPAAPAGGVEIDDLRKQVGELQKRLDSLSTEKS